MTNTRAANRDQATTPPATALTGLNGYARRHRAVRFQIQALATITVLGLTALPAAAQQAQSDEPAAPWRVDGKRSRIGFELAALGMVPLRGEFGRFDGVIDTDGDDGARIRLVIESDSLTMSHRSYERWARSPEFFDVQGHPAIRFVSDPVATYPVASGELAGTLVMRGVTQPVRFRLTPVDCEPAADDCTVRVEGEIDRRRFGMRSRRMTLSNRVYLDMTITVTRSPAASR